ncbi:MAG: tRNA (guanosine(37)-N1)-methyltransferase TrmD [Simkaniaceae bacterium]|nr:tRNA (guanosine(37)-N1)-methyltransferase TrmD [Simkaniaceae bacterium]
MRYDILSLFPEYFESPLNTSIIKRAREKGLIDVGLIDIRTFSRGRYKQVDDRPYGGGPGMVLMVEPVVEAIRSVRKEGSHVVFLTPQGAPLTAAKCRSLGETKKHLIFLCGHYEGIDQRAINLEVDEEISVGDFVLTSGCPAALICIDAISRFIPGVVGDADSVRMDSFEEGIFDSVHFTRPEVAYGLSVPEVLLSGHHANIDKWRRECATEKTRQVRPDLL